MIRFISILFFLLLIFSCKNQDSKIVFDKVTSVKSYTYSELKPLLEKKNGKTYVINFWATWCAPCVKELPAFEKINSKKKNVKINLVIYKFTKKICY